MNPFDEHTTIGAALHRSCSAIYDASVIFTSTGHVVILCGEFAFVFEKTAYDRELQTSIGIEDDWLEELCARCRRVHNEPEGRAAVTEIAVRMGITPRLE